MKKRKKTRFTAFLLMLVMLFTAIQPPAQAMAWEAKTDKDYVKGPQNGTWDYIYFGRYPQTEVLGDELTADITGATYDEYGDAEVNGQKYRRICLLEGYENTLQYHYFKWEPIRWRVLEKTEENLLVMSDVGLDNIPYSESVDSVPTWGSSYIKGWLNDFGGSKTYEPRYLTNDMYGTFYSYKDENGNYVKYQKRDEQEKVRSFYMTAFSKDERTAIINDTTVGRIFLPTVDDVKNTSYGLGTDASRILKSSDYACRKGTGYGLGTGSVAASSIWWLRPMEPSDGSLSSAAVAGSEGNIQDHSWIFSQYDNQVACVPAMRIKLSSNLWKLEDTIELTRQKAIDNTLYAYRTSEYQEEEGGSLLKILREARESINQAETAGEVDAVLKDVRIKVDALKTYREYELDEVKEDGDSQNPVLHHDEGMK